MKHMLAWQRRCVAMIAGLADGAIVIVNVLHDVCVVQMVRHPLLLELFCTTRLNFESMVTNHMAVGWFPITERSLHLFGNKEFPYDVDDERVVVCIGNMTNEF